MSIPYLMQDAEKSQNTIVTDTEGMSEQEVYMKKFCRDNQRTRIYCCLLVQSPWFLHAASFTLSVLLRLKKQNGMKQLKVLLKKKKKVLFFLIQHDIFFLICNMIDISVLWVKYLIEHLSYFFRSSIFTDSSQ